MIQKWYNRILMTSGLVAVFGLLIVFPILMSFEMGVVILNAIGIIVPICGIIFILLVFVGGMCKQNYFGHWVNHRY